MKIRQIVVTAGAGVAACAGFVMLFTGTAAAAASPSGSVEQAGVRITNYQDTERVSAISGARDQAEGSRYRSTVDYASMYRLCPSDWSVMTRDM